MKNTKLSFSVRTFVCIFSVVISALLPISAQTPTPIPSNLEKEFATAQLFFTEGVALRESDTPESQKAAIKKFQTALGMYQNLKAKVEEAYTLRAIAGLHAGLQENTTALKLYEQALGIFRQIKDQKAGEGKILTDIGAVYYNTNDYPRAIDYYLKSLLIYRELDDKQQQADTLAFIGYIYGLTDKYSDSLKFYLEALPIYEKLEKKDGLADNLKSIGETYFALDQKSRAIEYLERSLQVYQSLGDKENQSANLVLIGESYFLSSLPEKSVGYLEKALAIFQESGKEEEAASMRLKLASLYSAMGQKEKAATFSSKAGSPSSVTKNSVEKQMEKVVPLLMSIAAGDDEEEIIATVQNELSQLNKDAAREKGESAMNHGSRMLIAGFYYGVLQDAKRSQEYFDRGMAIARAERSNELEVIMLSFNGMIKGSSDPLIFIEYFKKALAIPSSLKTMRSMMILMVASAYLGVYEDDARPEYLKEASSYLHQGLALYRESGDKNIEASALAMLVTISTNLKQPQLAIFYGKQAINLLQSVRGNLKDLDQSLQDSYLERVKPIYHDLAEILIAQGRFFEAQQVMAMLKQDEYFDFIRRDADEIKKLAATLPPSSPERAALEKYDTLAGKVTEYAAEFAKLVELKDKPGFKQQAKYDDLKSKLDDANAAFRLFLDKGLLAELKQDVIKEIKIDRSLQAKLKEWGNGTVALYTVAGAERYRVILTTPATQTDGKFEIPVDELNKKIFRFRDALQNPGVDPRPLGKELYDILIKPIEKDLIAADAKTLIWSLDGTLRYIPLAALSPDGVHYLAEKYQNVIVTSTTRQSLGGETDPNWRVLGAGVTKASSLIEPGGTEKLTFSALPGVNSELLKIVSNEDAATPETGVLTGRRLIDETFNLAGFEDGMSKKVGATRKYNVVHLATHFRMGGDTARSFLLLGGNQVLTLEDVIDKTLLNFGNIELVTLSACNTGFGTTVENKVAINEKERKVLEENKGAEVDSLATFIELRGAKAVMASLWAVADESTSLLMSEFYRLRKENPKLTKAAAIQAAQLSMINGKLISASPNSGCRAEIVAGGKKCDPNAPFAHPYYWAPFVLIGNWM